MAYKTGQIANPKGRGKGTPNKLTKTIKDVWLLVFENMQGDPKRKLEAWAKTDIDTLTKFYEISAKLIPMEVQATIDLNVEWIEQRTYALPQSSSSDLLIDIPLSEAEVTNMPAAKEGPIIHPQAEDNGLSQG